MTHWDYDKLPSVFLSKRVLILCGLPVLLACSQTNIDNLNAFQKINAGQARVMPGKEELVGKKQRVAIFALRNNDEIAKRAKAGEAITRKLYEYLSQTNTELIDRATSAKYTEEIRLSQDSGLEYQGPRVADYVIDGVVDTVNFNVSYSPARKSQDLITGEEVVIPARCEYVGSIAGQYSLLKLPNMRLVKKYSFFDTEYYSENATQKQITSGEQILLTLFNTEVPKQCPVKTNVIDKLVGDAADESIRKQRVDIQNYFAPKGYINSVLTSENVYLIRVTVGKSNGLQQDQEVEIYSIVTDTDALTGEETQEKRLITEGLVTNQLGAKYAYIIIPDTDQAQKVKIGDFIRIKYSKSGFEKFTDFTF